jgi:serine/threonine protein phosphatase 1
MHDAAFGQGILPRRVKPLSSHQKSDGPMPDTPIFAIGIIRGQIDAFWHLLKQIEYQAETPRYARAKIILLGDLLGGKDSVALLDAVSAVERLSGGDVQVILGRNDRLLLDFLDNPPFHGAKWLRGGGQNLMEAFGIEGSEDVTADNYIEMADALRRPFGQENLNWLAERPLMWTTGNLVFSHAGLCPDKSLLQQVPEQVLTGHPRFHTVPRRDRRWVVYAEPGGSCGEKRGRRIAVGGGLPEQGRVDAVRIVAGEPLKIVTSASGSLRIAS